VGKKIAHILQTIAFIHFFGGGGGTEHQVNLYFSSAYVTNESIM
jgi:hypothetical protein